MPIIEKTSYRAPGFPQVGGQLQTLIPGLFRKVDGVSYSRTRMTLSDGDFLDLDWLKNGNKRLVIITHGLEGNSQRQYVRGMAKIFADHGWDALAWHCRSCSGEMNRAFKLYHHGDTADISEVIDHAISLGYSQISLVGFSLGANITLKYLGTKGTLVPAEVSHGVAFSGPCDLEAASLALDKPSNQIYKTRFLKALSQKVRRKAEQFPNKLDIARLDQLKVFRDFDEWFSAPICGYRDADEFYYQSSSKNFIPGIKVPALLINAKNDPILPASCMPFEEARQNRYFHFEMTLQGGHCGFMQPKDEHSWAERRALEFCQTI